jgi:glucokinase
VTLPCGSSSSVLAIDLGGTAVKVGIVAADGTVLIERRTPARESEGIVAWSETALCLARDVLTSAVDAPPSRLGLSVPGAVDAARATLVDLVERLPGASGLPLDQLFASLGLPVSADNDARAALEAERRWGVARGLDDLVLFTVGTGLGGAAIVGGSPPSGDPVLGAIQLGHCTVELDGDLCVCGNRGCAELWASGPGLVKMAQGNGVDACDAHSVFAAEMQGVPGAGLAIDHFVSALAAAVINSIHAYQPKMVVMGGGVMAAGDRIMQPLRRLIDERAWTVPRGRVGLEPSALGDHLGILGAAAVALRN